MKKLTALASFLFLLSGWSFGQINIYAGPSLTVGSVMTRNIAIDDTSRFFIGTSPSLAIGGGADVLIGFEERFKLQLGVAYFSRNLVLEPDNPVEGLSFTEIERTVSHVSIPMLLHYRMPLGDGPNWLNIMAGHSLDIISGDSTVIREPTTAVDSGGSFIRHEFVRKKQILPTVLLGVGLDREFNNGSILNISLIAGISTGTLIKGDIREWTTVNQDFDPDAEDVPVEFPDAYYDFALRGSYVGVRLSYWFKVASVFGDN